MICSLRTVLAFLMSRFRAQSRATRLGLQTSFKSRFDRAPKGTTVAQHPRPHARVKENSTVDVVLSAGPRPVTVPELDMPRGA